MNNERDILNTLDYFVEYTKKCPSNYINFQINQKLQKVKSYRKITRGYFNCEYLIEENNNELYNNEMATKYIRDIFNSKENQKVNFKIQEKDEYAFCFPFYLSKSGNISPLFFTKAEFRINKINNNYEVVLCETTIVESTLSKIIRERKILDEDSEMFLKLYSEMIQNINNSIKDLGDLGEYTISNLSQQLVQIFLKYVKIDKNLFMNDRFMILSDITVFISSKIYRSFADAKDKIIKHNTTKPFRCYLGLDEAKSYGIGDVLPNIHRGGYFTTYTVNEKQAKIMSALNQSDFLSISGPPGTGKTTILKEIIADYAVKRAGNLIEKMKSGTIQMTPQEMQSIVVTSSQNKAVDNIGAELLKEVDFFHFNPDNGYFCARLGNKNNIETCKEQFELLKNYISDIVDDENKILQYKMNFDTYAEYYGRLQHILDNVERIANSDIVEEVVKLMKMTSSEKEEYCNTVITNKNTDYFNIIEKQCSLEDSKLFDGINELPKNDLHKLKSFILQILTEVDETILSVENEIKSCKKESQEVQENVRKYKQKVKENDILILQLQNENFFKKLFMKSKINNEILLHTRENETYNEILDDNISHNDSLITKQKELSLKQQQHNKTKQFIDNQLSNINEYINEISEIENVFKLANTIQVEYNNIYPSNIDGITISENDVKKLIKNLNKHPDTEFDWVCLPIVRHLLFLCSVKIHECFVVLNAKTILPKIEKMFGADGIPVNEDIGLLYPVVTAPLLSLLDNKKFSTEKPIFHLLICDESGQAEAHLAVPVLNKVKKAIIAGDTKQLAPVVIDEDKKFATELEEKYNSPHKIIMQLGGNSVQNQADIQSDYKERYTEDDDYVGIIMNEHRRCEESIVNYSNHKVYGSKLTVVDEDNAVYKIKDDFNVPKLLGSNVVFLDVCGGNHNNENRKEVNVCKVLLKELEDIFKGCNNKDRVGIITPYRNQKDLLKEEIGKCDFSVIDIEEDIGTVHNFQGQARDIIIVSLCFDESVSPFIGSFINSNFLNVAFTRAKKQLIILGNYDACMKHNSPVKDAVKFYANLSKTSTPNMFRRIKPKFYSPYLSNEERFHNSLFDENVDEKFMLSLFQPFVSHQNIPNLFKNFFMNSSFVKEGSNKEILPFILNENIPKKSLMIVSPWITHWVVNDEFVDKIQYLVNNDVDVKICYGYNRAETIDIKEQLLIDGLLKTNTDIEKTYCQIIKLKKILGDNLKRINNSHSKIITIDDKYCFIGSYNWLCNSMERNKEITVFVEDEQEIIKLKELY